MGQRCPGGARTTCCPFRRLTTSSCGLRARVMSIASNQMLLNFGRTKSPGGSSREMGELATVVGRTRCNASANLVWAFVMPAIRLIDTRLASHKRSLRKLLCAGIPVAGSFADSAGLISTGRIAEIAARLPAIRRQASQPHRRRDGNRNPIVPPGCRPYGPLLIPLASAKGPDLGTISGLREENSAFRRGACQLAVRSPRRIYRQGGDRRRLPSDVVTGNYAGPTGTDHRARWPGAAMNQRWLAGNLLNFRVEGK